MNDSGRVYIFEPSQYLIDEKLHVVVRQPLSAKYIVQIGPHQMGDEVHLLKSFQAVFGIGMKNVE